MEHASFDTKYGLQWFRAEASALSYEKRRSLYSKICQWESMAKHGCQSWAMSHSSANHARNRRPLEGHMRNLLIEVKGSEWVHQTDIEHLKEKQKREMESQEYRRKNEEYNSKLDSALDDLLR